MKTMLHIVGWQGREIIMILLLLIINMYSYYTEDRIVNGTKLLVKKVKYIGF